MTIDDEQKFRLTITDTLAKMSADVRNIAKENKRQNELFDEHRKNMRQALKDHQDKVEQSIKEVVAEQKNLRSFVDKVTAGLAILVFVVPVVLTSLEVSALFKSSSNSDTVAVETGNS